MTRMSQAMFKMVEADKDLVVGFLRRRGLSETDIRRKPASYFKKHCRRVIPPPAELVARLGEVFNFFEYAIDTATRVPVFSAATKQAYLNLIKLAEDGLLSDEHKRPLKS